MIARRPGLQHQRGRQLHREPRQGRRVPGAVLHNTAQAGRRSTASTSPSSSRSCAAAATAGRSPPPRGAARRGGRGPPAAAAGERGELTRPPCRPDWKASPGRRAPSSGRSSGPIIFGLLYWRSSTKQQARSGRAGRAPRRAAGQDPGRSGGQAEAAAVPRGGAAPRARARQAAAHPAGAAQHPGPAAPHPRPDRAGQLRPRCASRPATSSTATSTASGRSPSTCTARTTTWRMFFDRVGRFSRIINVENLGRSAPSARRAAGTRSRASFIAKTFVYKETPPPEPAGAAGGRGRLADGRRRDRSAHRAARWSPLLALPAAAGAAGAGDRRRCRCRRRGQPAEADRRDARGRRRRSSRARATATTRAPAATRSVAARRPRSGRSARARGRRAFPAC